MPEPSRHSAGSLPDEAVPCFAMFWGRTHDETALTQTFPPSVPPLLKRARAVPFHPSDLPHLPAFFLSTAFLHLLSRALNGNALVLSCLRPPTGLAGRRNHGETCPDLSGEYLPREWSFRGEAGGVPPCLSGALPPAEFGTAPLYLGTGAVSCSGGLSGGRLREEGYQVWSSS